MKRKLFLIITILCLLTAILLCEASCQNGGGNDEPTETATDPGALIAGGEGSVFFDHLSRALGRL